MRISDSRAVRGCLAALIVLAGAAVLPSATKKTVFTTRDKAFYASPNTINFVRPGFLIKIVSAKIADDGTASVNFKITDPKGLGLDRLGVTSPGTISLSFLLAYIPKGQKQFVTYATRTRTSTDGKTTVVQATGDSTGTFVQNAEGDYTYTYSVKAPKDWDKTATHRVGIYGNRNLTEFDMGTYYDDETFTMVPAGGTPVARDVIRTESCNQCHDQLAFHGGSRRSMELCVMCHTPQLPDPNGPTADFKVMIHKIHAGDVLPSVVAGGKYTIGTSDWSSVAFPSDVRRCETCHEPDKGAAQADAWLKNPSRAACGSCHDNIDFATGKNHLSLPQVSDNQCAECHIPKGETEFDASIRGAHTMPQEAPSRPGVVVTLTKVENGGAGQKPTITFTLKDFKGAPISLATMTAISTNRLSINLTGPTSDYGTTKFGRTQPAPATSAKTRSPPPPSQVRAGRYLHLHLHPRGSGWSEGHLCDRVEARRTMTINAGTVNQADTRYAADNKVMYFSVDGISDRETPPGSGHRQVQPVSHPARAARREPESDRVLRLLPQSEQCFRRCSAGSDRLPRHGSQDPLRREHGGVSAIPTRSATAISGRSLPGVHTNGAHRATPPTAPCAT